MATEKQKKKKTVKKPVKKHKSTPHSDPHIKREPVLEKDIKLIKGTGSAEHGGKPDGYYWHIYVADKRAGYIYINTISDDFFGEHPAISIFINKADRGKQIGRIAYRLACEQSNYDAVYAHMRKSNKASIRAAEEAGFVIIEKEGLPQRSMIWKRNKTQS